MTTTAKNTEFCVIRTRKFYGPDYQYSLVSEMTREGDETGKVVFETREAAQAALDREQEEITRGYGAYMCAHNESGSPDFEIVSANQSRARRLLRSRTCEHRHETVCDGTSTCTVCEESEEKFTVRQDPSDNSNWGIVWETSGTEGGYTSEAAARKSALAQNGTEADTSESQTWDW